MSGDRDDEQPGHPAPEERQDGVGARTMQLDAISDEVFEDLGYPVGDGAEEDGVPPPAAAPPPLPRRRGKRWNAPAIAALLGVVVVAAVLGLIAANLIFGGDEPAEASAGPTSAEGAQTGAAAGAEAEEEGEPEFVPLELDEVVIESGSGDGTGEEATE